MVGLLGFMGCFSFGLGLQVFVFGLDKSPREPAAWLNARPR